MLNLESVRSDLKSRLHLPTFALWASVLTINMGITATITGRVADVWGALPRVSHRAYHISAISVLICVLLRGVSENVGKGHNPMFCP